MQYVSWYIETANEEKYRGKNSKKMKTQKRKNGKLNMEKWRDEEDEKYRKDDNISKIIDIL